MNIQRSFFIMLFVLIANIQAFSQNTLSKDSTQLQPKGKLLEIISADKYNFQDKDTLGKFISLVGKARVKQDKTYFEADSIVLNQKENTMEAFGNIHINDADSVHTYAQYVKYYGKEKKAFLNKDVKLTDGKGVLTSNDLEYDVQSKVGTYLNGGKLVNGKTTLTSKEGYYYGDNGNMIFKKKVILKSPDAKVFTDTLFYNINSELVTYHTPTTIINGKRTIKSKEGYYDMKSKHASFGSRSVIDDSSYTLVADTMLFNDQTGLNEMHGKVIYKSKDKIGGYDLMSNHLTVNKKTNALLATEHPLLLIKQDKDSFFLSADTLYSALVSDFEKTHIIPVVRDSTSKIRLHQKNKKDSSEEPRFFQAYNHVRIFSDSMQAVCDSMFYSLKDSVFRLFQNPIAWAQENQLTGDTMYIYLQNKKPERIKVYEEAMAISKINNQFYNQVRGTILNAYFEDGNIHFLKTKGSPADNVYYAQDEKKKFIGVNKSSSDIIEVYFKENKPQKVVLVNNLQGTLFPMKQVNHDEIKVKRFQWLDELRPKSKFEFKSTNNLHSDSTLIKSFK